MIVSVNPFSGEVSEREVTYHKIPISYCDLDILNHCNKDKITHKCDEEYDTITTTAIAQYFYHY